MNGMPTKNTIVVPCMVNMRLKACGGNEVIVRHHQLDTNHCRLQAGGDEEQQRDDDIHQAELLVVDGENPFAQEAGPESLLRVEPLRLCKERLPLFSGLGLLQRRQVGHYLV